AASIIGPYEQKPLPSPAWPALIGYETDCRDLLNKRRERIRRAEACEADNLEQNTYIKSMSAPSQLSPDFVLNEYSLND
ncbi:hypothetical protein PENTCL1PPCAC_5093, partial [Pristionchus entomophagus]